jgi:chromosome segregation ATPase
MSEVFAERDYHPHDMTSIGDAARRVASYAEGKERLNVYKTARDELAALEARATAAEAENAKLKDEITNLRAELAEACARRTIEAAAEIRSLRAQVARVAQERAGIVAMVRSQAEWHDKHDDGWSGFDKMAQGMREIADAIERHEDKEPRA